jgi:hypothetical protein
MKVSDLRRKLFATLVAGGLVAPGALHAANLDTNLVTNPGFETVDINTIGGTYDSPQILQWTGPAAFAYAHAGGGGIGPDYANGGPLANGGAYYFTPNNLVPDALAPGQYFQDIDVSTGASGALIAGGTAGFRINADFGSFGTQGDLGHVHLNFLNASNAALGSAEIVNADPKTWNNVTQGGLIPTGTAKVRVSLFGTTTVAGGPDGYIDNVDFRVVNEVIQTALGVSVNRATGAITLSNLTGSPKNLASYSITSALGALAPANWLSIADNYDSGSPGPNQVDPTHPWTELTMADAHGDLSEADLASGDGATLPHGRSITIGNAGAWLRTNREELVFEYVSGGVVVPGIVTYSGGAAAATGDLNFDGAITAADWTIVRSNQKSNLSALSLAEAYRVGDLTGDRQNDHADFTAFKGIFDAANGVGSFAAMLAAVPEPSSCVVALAAGVMLLPARRRAGRGSSSCR